MERDVNMEFAYFFGLIICIWSSCRCLYFHINSVFYILFRFASWIFYTEIQINIESGEMIKVKKIINKTQNINLITNKFDSSKFEYTELKRTGNTKFLMNYKTHKNNELLILRNKTDKKFIEKYIVEKIIIKN